MVKCKECSGRIHDGESVVRHRGMWFHNECYSNYKNSVADQFPEISDDIVRGLDRERQLSKLKSEWCVISRTPEFEYSAAVCETKKDVVSVYMLTEREESPWIPIMICHNGSPISFVAEHTLTIHCESEGWSESETWPDPAR